MRFRGLYSIDCDEAIENRPSKEQHGVVSISLVQQSQPVARHSLDGDSEQISDSFRGMPVANQF
jgi:hypothetical protein